MRHLLRLLLVLLCFGHLSFAASATVRAESSAQGEMLRMQLGAEELPSSFGGYAGISAARGDYLGPGFSLAAAVPFIGDFAAAGKAIRSVTQVSRVSHSAAPVISAARVERAVANSGGKGGLNLFRAGPDGNTTRGATNGWKEGDRMLYLPNKGSVQANWGQNSGRLRQEMSQSNPIFDSYRDAASGLQIPTGTTPSSGGRFLNAERKLLESRGWQYTPSNGAYHPPNP